MFPSWNHSRTLRTAVVAGHRGQIGMPPGHDGLIRTGTADLTGSAVQKGEDPGASPEAKEVLQALQGVKLRYVALALYLIERRSMRGLG